MIKRKGTFFIILVGTAAVALLNDLSAQVIYQNPPRVEDFSTFSTKLINARTTFNVSTEIVESSTVEKISEISGSEFKKLGLAVSPPYVFFENDVKTAEMTITNIGSLNTIYRIELVNTVFDEAGQRTLVDPTMQAEFENKGVRFADKMLKFAPRWVRLKPAEQQLIRVAAVLPEAQEDGEYRSELKFDWQQDSEELASMGSIEESFSPGTASSTELQIDNNEDTKSIYIPLIIRLGNLSATAQLTQLYLECSDESTVLNLKILREGNRSLYGDLLISGLNKQNEKTGTLHTVSNVAIYPPSTHIELSLDLKEAMSKDSKNIESLMIEFKSKGNTDKNVIMASSTIKLINGARASAE